MSRVPPAYQRYPQRFAAATATWDPFEVGCYQILLDVQWDLGERGLPDDLARLAAAVRCRPSETNRFLAAWDELLEEKFPPCADGRRRNQTLEEIRSEQDEYRRRRSAAGKAGAAAKRSNREANGKQTLNDCSTIATSKREALLPPTSGLLPPTFNPPVSEGESEGGPEREDAPAATDPAIFEFPCKASRRCTALVWFLRQSKLEEWVDAYPGLDVQAEVRRALQWCRDNPEKRKTARGMSRFLGAWLAREARAETANDPEYSPQELEAMTPPVEVP